MFITFQMDNEVIVTTRKHETETIQLYFINGGRILEDYERVEHTGVVAVAIDSRLSLR